MNRTQKPRSKIWSAIKLSLSAYWQVRKSLVICCALAVIFRVALPYTGIYMPKAVIDLIQQQAEPSRFLLVVGSLALLMVALGYGKSFTDTIVEHSTGTLSIFSFMLRTLSKQINMDYEQFEHPDFKTVMDKSEKAVQSNHTLAMNIPRTLVQLVSNGFSFLLYAGVIARINPVMLLVLLFCAASNWWALARSRAYIESTREDRGKLNRKYLAMQSTMRDPMSAKDIRLYGAFPWLKRFLQSLRTQNRQAEKAVLTRQMRVSLLDAALILLRDGIAYGLLISLLLQDKLALGEFVFVFAAIGALGGWISGILVAASDLGKSAVEMADMQSMLSYPDRMNTGTGAPLPEKEALPPEIRFEDVSYTYPNADKPALRQVNLTIRPGERLAVVGANGAGKTTLVKLLCGLYLPTEGQVTYAGKPLLAYNRDALYTQFSPVFQDIHLLSTDIAGNISQQPPDMTDDAKVARCLELAGLDDKVSSLPEKEKTLLVRAVHAQATELSGGEKQKLAMARALYKDAPVILLDEPTAALDPLAENEVYQKYAELTRGKTSVYISHRLASTRFCDRIVLIDGAAEKDSIAETGTHDELMKLGGLYARMFATQASYYRKTGAVAADREPSRDSRGEEQADGA
ncbi:MAG: ABC transporter ATP-binding protein [Clostridiaceae bacterium]|jgi:ABC-type multidrug transport system fused ATPase/permease subunit|nr:ABC transporter ATP-binding protein [Clostridiaceae bacterium]